MGVLRGEYDIIIIGGGAAGFSAAVAAAEAGASVLLASDGPLGGTCVNYGCVPTKYMLSRLASARRAGETPRLSSVVAEAVRVAEELRRDRYESLIEELGVDYHRGSARFKARGLVEVNGREVKYKRAAIIAVGAKAWRPPVKGLNSVEHATIDNERLFIEPLDPRSVVVLGGRAQGIEIAQIMARSGVETTLVQRSPRLLPEEEPEAGIVLKEVLEEDGVRVYTSTRLREVEPAPGGGVRVRFSHGPRTVEVEAEYIYLATGRRPRLEGLGLERVGVRVTRDGFIEVDEYLRAADGVYAAGDCVNGYMLEPVAAREGYVAALNALGERVKMDYTVIPRAVFTDPEFARVGLTEAELARRLGVCACRVVDAQAVPKARILGYGKGFFKLVIDPRNRRVVGVSMVAPNAAEAIHEAAVAIKAGFTIDDLIDMIHVFPTIAEGIKYAALAFYRDVTKMPCCLL